MFRFTIRELVLLTLVVALGVAWWLDRNRLTIPAADYQRLKADEVARLKEEMKAIDALMNSIPINTPAPSAERLGPDGLRRVLGEKDYQLPPIYPLHYGPPRP